MLYTSVLWKLTFCLYRLSLQLLNILNITLQLSKTEWSVRNSVFILYHLKWNYEAEIETERQNKTLGNREDGDQLLLGSRVRRNHRNWNSAAAEIMQTWTEINVADNKRKHNADNNSNNNNDYKNNNNNKS